MSNTTIIEIPQTQIIANPNANFIGGKAENFNLQQIRNAHTIPVFSADNTPTISQAEFIGITEKLATDIFNESPSSLAVKLSHPRKGRTFEARGKAVADLLDHEKTIFYERCAFLMEFPIANTVEGNDIFLTVAGIKAYNLDNLNTTGTKGRQHFKIAVGFKVQVCTNLCILPTG